jgi:bifunctional UDP-N-acetylglucosamine pyrophosphorylase/glucosamine-1-phosphate N-acetyltransferase
MTLNVVILAAGQGKRMYSALPKVLHKLAGKPLLGHVIDAAQTLRPTKICTVYGHGGSNVPNVFDEGAVIWVKQEPQLGTGHAVMQTLPHIDDTGTTLILYGDVPLVTVDTMRALVAIADQGKLALLTVNLEDPSGYGRIVRDGSGNVLSIIEHKDASEAQRAIREVNTGIMAVPGEHLARWLSNLSDDNAQKEYYLTDIVAQAVAEGVIVEAHTLSRIWESLGVNSRSQLAELERIHQRNLAHALMEKGVALADPARIDIRGHLTCGRDVFIDVNCVFEGEVTLADNVAISANCVLKNVKVEMGGRIEPFCHIEDAVIGPASRVGPYARIRPGTVLAEDVHIGNFVELKNSQIAAHSKANHLTYIGDATVGSNVNIGAGTIVCNYDGANKHRTIIEDDVFIGSDSQLIAPVTVKRGATLGAGTTLTTDAPAGQLTVSRAKQQTVPGWKRPVKRPKG